MQQPQTTQQLIDKVDALLDATERAGRYDTVFLDGYDEWFSAASSRRDRRISTAKSIVNSVAVFAIAFLFANALTVQPDYKTHYSNQPCDVSASVQNIHNLFA